MTVSNIICLLEFCLKNTYFLFHGRYYEQVEGAAMGSPVSPIVANLYIEEFEIKALNKHHFPLVCGEDLWMTHFVVIQSAHKNSFIEHIIPLIIEFNSLWKTARLMDPCVFGHFGYSPTRWQFQH